MPIYEFECRQCGAGFERLQKLSDPDPEQCPACSASGSIRRRISAPSFRLAGSGWYETDFKKDGDRKANLATRDEAPKVDAAKPDSAPVAAAASSPAPAATPKSAD